MNSSKVYDFDPRNLPQDVLAAIGLVTSCSALTEDVVQQGIGGCLGVDFEYSAGITTHMAAPLRDHVPRAVAEIKIDNLDDLDELDRLLDQINAAFSKRNVYVHDAWCRDPDTGKCFTTKTTARGRLEMDLIPMPINQIKEDATFIYNAAMELYTFLLDRNLVPSMPTGSRPRGHKSRAARKKRREGLLKK
jgi:hypothetical protein